MQRRDAAQEAEGSRLAPHSKASQEQILADMARAETLFKMALAINPRCIVCHANAADLYLRLDRNEEAEAACRAQVTRSRLATASV